MVRSVATGLSQYYLVGIERGAGGVYGPRPELECVLQTTDARQRIGPVERSKSYQYHHIN